MKSAFWAWAFVVYYTVGHIVYCGYVLYLLSKERR